MSMGGQLKYESNVRLSHSSKTIQLTQSRRAFSTYPLTTVDLSRHCHPRSAPRTQVAQGLAMVWVEAPPHQLRHGHCR